MIYLSAGLKSKFAPEIRNISRDFADGILMA